jgi:hypothetical protein
MQELKQKTHFIHSLQNLLSHSRFSLSTKQHIHMYSLQRAHTHTHTHIQPSKLSHTFIKITQHYIYIYIYVHLSQVNKPTISSTHSWFEQASNYWFAFSIGQKSSSVLKEKRSLYYMYLVSLFFFFLEKKK